MSYLDSMGGRNQACLDALMQYLKDEHQDKKGAPFDDSGWKAECLKVSRIKFLINLKIHFSSYLEKNDF